MANNWTPDQIKKIIDDQEASNRRNAQAEINEAFRTVTQDSVNTLPENIFVQSFLPLFAGRLDQNSAKLAIQDWVGVAGSPSNPVIVVDGENKRIFTVPPLVATFAIQPERKLANRDAAVGEIINNYVLNRHTSPHAAAAILNRDMLRKVASISSVKTAEDTAQKVAEIWDTIFERYGLKEKKTIQQAIAGGDAADDMIFEDN